MQGSKGRKNTDEVSDHHHRACKQIDQCCDDYNRYPVLIEGVRLEIDEGLSLQAVHVVFPAMPDGMCGKNLPNTVPVAKVLM